MVEWELKEEDVKLAQTFQKQEEDNRGLQVSDNLHTLRTKEMSFKKEICTLPFYLFFKFSFYFIFKFLIHFIF